MIYAIQQGGRTVALTNCKNDLLRFPDFEIRYATPTEDAHYLATVAANVRAQSEQRC
jgi:hypothetical protein